MKNEATNVVSLFGAKKTVPSQVNYPKELDAEKSADNFLNSMKKNVENAERKVLFTTARQGHNNVATTMFVTVNFWTGKQGVLHI
jgi:hypothetical protein